MVRKVILFTTIITIIAFFVTGFKATNKKETYKTFITGPLSEAVYYTLNNKKEIENEIKFPYVGKGFVAFKQAVAFKESQGKFSAVNSLGYMGKYQFGKTTLQTVGISNTQKFMKSPRMQEKAFKALLAQNKWFLRHEIQKYSGTVINGVTITESGILAAAHLGGVGSTRRFLRSKGKDTYTDGFGTSITSYFKKFGGYDTSVILANPNAKVRM